jgi:hypothetical protein
MSTVRAAAVRLERLCPLILLILMGGLVPFTAFPLDPVPSYTAEELRENARSFLMVREKKQPLTAEAALHAMEFKGYVAGILDAGTGLYDPKNPDAKLAECARRKSVGDIAHRVAVLITTGPLDRSIPAPWQLGISLYAACDDAAWTSPK